MSAHGEYTPITVRADTATEPKVTITIERRPDGGLRVWSEDVRGLHLSHSDAKAVLADIGPALDVLAPQLFAPPSVR